jgi:hypothetical protein
LVVQITDTTIADFFADTDNNVHCSTMSILFELLRRKKDGYHSLAVVGHAARTGEFQLLMLCHLQGLLEILLKMGCMPSKNFRHLPSLDGPDPLRLFCQLHIRRTHPHKRINYAFASRSQTATDIARR